MIKITEASTVNIGILSMLIVLAFSVGISFNKIEVLGTQVNAIESESVNSKKDFHEFQIEVITRLSRIESKVELGVQKVEKVEKLVK